MGNSQKKTNANEMPITGDLIQIFPSGFVNPSNEKFDMQIFSIKNIWNV